MADDKRLNEILDVYEQALAEGDAETASRAKAAYKREAASAEAEAAPQRSLGQEVVRQVGRTADIAGKGVASVVGLVADPIGGLMNKGLDAIGVGGPRYVPQRQAAEAASQAMGLPQAESELEQVVGKVGETAVAVGTGAGAAGLAARGTTGAAQAVLGALAEAPGMQMVSAVGGSAAADAAERNGAGVLGQTAAALLGAVASPMAVRGAGRVATRVVKPVSEYAENARLFKEVGLSEHAGKTTVPTLGVGSRSRLVGGIERMLGNYTTKLDESYNALEHHLGNRADDLAQQADVAGDVLQRGGFLSKGERMAGLADKAEAGSLVAMDIDAFSVGERRKIGKLYDDLARFIPDESPVEVKGALSAVERLRGDSDLTKRIADVLGGERFRQVVDILRSGADSGQITFKSLRQIRTLIGDRLASTSVLDDGDRRLFEQLYGSLSDDIKAAAERAGPNALKAFEVANGAARAQHELMGDALRPITQKVAQLGASDEAIYDTVVRMAQTSPSQARRLFAKDGPLGDTATGVVRANMIKRMGRSVPSQQGSDGAEFSARTFLTNWNNMEEGTRAAVFGGDLTASLTKLARAAARLDKQTRRKSIGSGSLNTAVATGVGAAGWALVGSPLGLLTVPGAMFVGNMAGRMMANPYRTAKLLSSPTVTRLMQSPGFVSWLSRAPSVRKPSELSGYLASLASVADKEPGMVPYLQEYMEAMKSGAGEMREAFRISAQPNEDETQSPYRVKSVEQVK